MGGRPTVKVNEPPKPAPPSAGAAPALRPVVRSRCGRTPFAHSALLFSAFGILLLTACGRERSGDPSLTVVVRVSPTPAAVGPARIMVEVAGESAVPDARVSVTAFPDGGGRPVADSALPEAPGRFVVPALPFPSRGEWTLRVRVELPDGRWAEVTHPVLVVGGPGSMP